MIYFIQATDSGAVKIGMAKNVQSRLRALQTSHPYKLTVIREIAGARFEEEWLHEKFSALRLIGEWFTFTDEMLVAIPPARAGGIDKPVHPITAAIRRRVGSGRPVSTKLLADAVGVSEGTVENWLKGTMPGGSKLQRMWLFFDPMFFSEITDFKFEMTKPDHPTFAAVSKVAEGMAELQRMEVGR